MKTLESSKGSKSTKREKLFTSEFSPGNEQKYMMRELCNKLGLMFCELLFCSFQQEAVEINQVVEKIITNDNKIILKIATMKMMISTKQNMN